MFEDTKSNPVYIISWRRTICNLTCQFDFWTLKFRKVVYIATRLRYGGSFNDHFVTLSLLSPKVKESWKSVNICYSSVMGTNSSVFFTHGVYSDIELVLSGTKLFCGTLSSGRPNQVTVYATVLSGSKQLDRSLYRTICVPASWSNTERNTEIPRYL